MCVIADGLVKAFGSHEGDIPIDKLRAALQSLNPCFSDAELDRLMHIADESQQGSIGQAQFLDFCGCNAIATVAGQRLPDGADSDSKLARLHDCLGKLRGECPAKKPWLEELRDLLDPYQNSSGYRLCQDAAVGEGSVRLALSLTRKEHSDAVRSIAWECLARLAFGNSAAAEEVAGAAEFLPALQCTLYEGTPPEKLSALQLVQAVGAASGEAAGQAVPGLLMAVVPFLSDTSFKALTELAFDFLVSCSCRYASEVADVVGWPQLAMLVSEGQGRPEWLPVQPLQILLCGRLVVNLLSGPAPEGEDDLRARENMATCLSEGYFFDYYAECLEAAVARREWPVGKEAYHSVLRLAEIAIKLAALGHSRRLVSSVAPLTHVIEVVIDDQTSRAALRALRALCADVACLEALLSMETFRKDTLDMLHKSGDESEATDLVCYMDVAELSLLGANAALDVSKTDNLHAPSVRQLADLFGQFVPLDNEMNSPQLLRAFTEIPLAPSAVVAATMQSRLSDSCFNFQSFAECVYGTPTRLGYWPSLMEDAAAMLEALGDVPRLPSLVKAAELFEAAAEGKSCVKGANAIFEKVLPSLGLTAEDPIVESELISLGEEELEFREFVEWVGQLCVKIRDAQACT